MEGTFWKNITMNYNEKTRELIITYNKQGDDLFEIKEVIRGERQPKTIDDLRVRTAFVLYENIKKFEENKYEMPREVDLYVSLLSIDQLLKGKNDITRFPSIGQINFLANDNEVKLFINPIGELTGSSYHLNVLSTEYDVPDENVKVYGKGEERSIRKTCLYYYTVCGFYYVFYELNKDMYERIYGDVDKKYRFEEFIEEMIDEEGINELKKQFNTDNLFDYIDKTTKVDKEQEFIKAVAEKRLECLFLK